ADGSVNVSDVTALVNQIIGSGSYSAQACDVNGDGSVNVSDVTALVNLIINGGDESEFKNRTFTVNGVSFEMIAVEGGTFTMGATSEQGSDAYSNESPTHQVTLSSYYIAKTEVTQELWQAVMGSNPSNFSGTNLPVETVSWNNCQEFITKLNELTGKNFRLPTEAEWEYAARGGNKSQGYKYSGSNTIDDVAWYYDNNSDTTHPVGTKAPNELGIYDMSGNVREWCSDRYGSYTSSAQTNPTGANSGSDRVYRGGCWYNSARECRVSYRDCLIQTYRNRIIGFRLAL
ncbi:MAG: SUMF1/EgtB/PvdO family nonheme iron enzyme, partial [Sodaliphilus sp.]